MNGKRTKLRIWEFGRSSHGSAAAEFALCIPLLIIIMVAIIEMGRGLHDFHVVNETVRDAARFLGRAPIDCTGAGAATTCQPCNIASGVCGSCFFTDTTAIQDAVAIAMTGDLSGTQDLLGYWEHPADAVSTITVEVCRIDNTSQVFTVQGSGPYDLTGIYSSDSAGVVPDTIVPHVRMNADVPFTFMFGELITPGSMLEFSLAHNVIITGR